MHRIRLTSSKINRRLRLIEPLVYRCRQPLPHFRHLKLESPLVDPPVSPQVDDANWQPLPWGSYWCEPHADFVLRTQFRIPPDWNVDSPMALHLPIGKAGDFSHPEALAYIDGVPSAACDRHHQEILLPPRLFDGAPHLLALHGWAGSLRNDRDARLLMRECALVQIDQPTRDFIALARVALGVADHLDENEPARGHLYAALDEAFKVLDTREPFGEPFYASVPAAHETLREGIAQAGGPLDVNITAVGHAHIDVAWLWTLSQTRRKAGRTFYNVMRISLLRSPTTPDPEADQGEHRFAYSLFPHEGGWDERTVAEAYALNDPLIVWATGTQHASRITHHEPFITTDQPNVVIETIKQAEDGQGVIVRLYESQGRRGQCTLTTGFPLAKAWRANILEENLERLDVNDRQLRFSIKPYQIITLRLLPKDLDARMTVGWNNPESRTCSGVARVISLFNNVDLPGTPQQVEDSAT